MSYRHKDYTNSDHFIEAYLVDSSAQDDKFEGIRKINTIHKAESKKASRL